MTDDDLREAIEEARAMASAEQKLSALERLRRSVLAERRLLRILTIIAIAVGMMGIGLSLHSLGIASDAQDALDEFQASRVEARVTSCESFNDQQQRSISANEAQLRVVFEATGRVRDAEEQAQLEVLYEKHDKVIESAFPMRDCSAAGIAEFYGDKP